MMIETKLTDLEVTSEVEGALRDFAAALTETPQFARFELAAGALRGDEEAQNAIFAYESKQRSMQMLLMLNAVSEQEQAKLESLRQTVFSNSTVMGYVSTQEDLMALCQAVNDMLSDHLGMRFALRRGGCCG